MNMSERGRLGGIARNGTTMAQHRRDVEECRAYLAAHPGATVYDVSLELHYSTEAARRIMMAANSDLDMRELKKRYLECIPRLGL